MVRFAAGVVGALVALFPFAVGWGVVMDPLRRRGKNGGHEADTSKYVPVCPLDALPADGIPRPFAIVADVSDAWMHTPARRVGSIFLTRSDKGAEPSVTALSATCPHLGCALEFDAANNQFECPCHKSGFDKEGNQLFGPSRRGMDPLPVKVLDSRGTKQVGVEFQRFQAGIPERKPIG